MPAYNRDLNSLRRPIRSERVVLADNNRETRLYLEALLSGQGWEVESVHDGEAALEAVRRNRPDALVADMAIPTLGGLELIAALRGDDEFIDLPILLLSASASEDERIGSLEAGAEHFLAKPFSEREFIARMKGMLTLSNLRRAAAEHLLRSDKRLQAAVDLVGLSLYDWNPATNALEWDDHLRAMWGLPPGAPVNYDVWLTAIHQDDRNRVEAAVERSANSEGDGIYDIEYRVIGVTDGIERWISTFGRTWFDNGKPVGFIGAALEITERKRADERLRTSEERFRQFATHSRDAITIFDVDPIRFEYLSPAFENIWGDSAAIFLSDISSWTATIHPDDRSSTWDALERASNGENIVQQYRIIRRGSAVRWIRHGLFPIRDEESCVRRIGGIAEDITRDDGDQVYVIDSNGNSSRRLLLLLEDAGYEVTSFASSRAFLDIAPVLLPGCIIFHMDGVGHDDLIVLRELKARHIQLPVIVSGSSGGDIAIVVQAMKAGAVDWLENPYANELMLAAVASALAVVRDAIEMNGTTELARKRIAEMPSREREVLLGLLAGETNKIIARRLGISPRTVELHRARLMERLGVRSLSEVVFLATSVGLAPTPAPWPSDGRNQRHGKAK